MTWRTLALALLVASPALAGGGPQNVLVLYNGDDLEAEETAQFYAEARALPDGHLCPLTGASLAEGAVPFDDFTTLVRRPFDACLESLVEPDAIDYVVVVRGLPYRVDLPDAGYHTSLGAMLQVGGTTHETSGGELAGFSAESMFRRIQNPFFPHDAEPEAGDYTLTNATEAAYTAATWWTRQAELPASFRRGDGDTVNRWVMDDTLFVVTRLDGFDHADARALVDRSLAADGSFPDAELLSMAAADGARGARDPEAEYTSRMLDGAGLNATWLPEHEAELSGHTVAAYLTGAAELRDAIDGQTYVPGAIVDNLTSFGAVPANWYCEEACPQNESQTSIARFVRAGATGVHGTVAEPFNPVFPNAGTLMLYTAGYNLAESFFFNQRWLYWQNLYVGDPLTTPYGERPTFEAPQSVEQDVPWTIVANHSDGVAWVVARENGVVIAEGEGSLDIDLSDRAALDVVTVSVTAGSADASIDRPGWDVASPVARAEVQGWTTLSVTVLPTPEPDPVPEDCSCEGSPSAALLLIPVFGLTRRNWDSRSPLHRGRVPRRRRHVRPLRHRRARDG